MFSDERRERLVIIVSGNVRVGYRGTSVRSCGGQFFHVAPSIYWNKTKPKLPVSAENIALKYLYGLLTEALGNLSLPCASRAAWPSAACATPSPVSVRRFSFSRTVLLLERFQPVRWRLAASDNWLSSSKKALRITPAGFAKAQ